MKALRNLIRMPARSVIFLCIDTVLSLLLIGMLIIHGIAGESIRKTVGPLNSCVKVSSDSGKSRLTLNNAQDISNGFGVIQGYHAWAETIGELTGLMHFDVEKNTDPAGTGKAEFAPFSIFAVTSTDIMSDFYSGRRIIVSGDGISREDNDSGKLKLVVSEALAELNHLKLGDRVDITVKTVYSPDPVSCTVYVGGIYSDTINYNNNAAYSYQMPENDVYIPMSVYDYMMSASVDNITPKELYFELEHMSPKVISALEDRLRTVGLYTTTDISLVPFTPETESAAMSKMATALDIAISAVAICFACSLLGLLMWNLQSRKREIGIYCVLGMKRSRISAGLTRETLGLFLPAFLLSVSALCTVLLCRGEALYLKLFPGTGNAAYETTVDTVLYNAAVRHAVTETFADPARILSQYLLPAVLTAAVICMVVIMLVHAVSFVIISRFDAMRTMGGNTQ